ncbi:MAG: hypothetical protein ABIA02_03960 [Candidatus Falkowbacteria bacterium]
MEKLKTVAEELAEIESTLEKAKMFGNMAKKISLLIDAQKTNPDPALCREIREKIKETNKLLCQSLKILNHYSANYLGKFLIKFNVNFFGDFNLILV